MWPALQHYATRFSPMPVCRGNVSEQAHARSEEGVDCHLPSFTFCAKPFPPLLRCFSPLRYTTYGHCTEPYIMACKEGG